MNLFLYTTKEKPEIPIMYAGQVTQDILDGQDESEIVQWFALDHREDGTWIVTHDGQRLVRPGDWILLGGQPNQFNRDKCPIFVMDAIRFRRGYIPLPKESMGYDD